jgi:hypothetical protein
LEALFPGTSFASTRDLPWLRIGINGRGLELDCYSEEMGLALEYQGEQHYVPVSHFGGAAALVSIQHRDSLKREACEQAMVSLIEIPYTCMRGALQESEKLELITHEIWTQVSDLGYPPGTHVDLPTLTALMSGG